MVVVGCRNPGSPPNTKGRVRAADGVNRDRRDEVRPIAKPPGDGPARARRPCARRRARSGRCRSRRRRRCRSGRRRRSRRSRRRHRRRGLCRDCRRGRLCLGARHIERKYGQRGQHEDGDNGGATFAHTRMLVTAWSSCLASRSLVALQLMRAIPSRARMRPRRTRDRGLAHPCLTQIGSRVCWCSHAIGIKRKRMTRAALMSDHSCTASRRCGIANEI